MIVCFFKQKTAYELRISDWSSDVCSSDLADEQGGRGFRIEVRMQFAPCLSGVEQGMQPFAIMADQGLGHALGKRLARSLQLPEQHSRSCSDRARRFPSARSEEHTSELQSLMRISSAVFCLKKQTLQINYIQY